MQAVPIIPLFPFIMYIHPPLPVTGAQVIAAAFAKVDADKSDISWANQYDFAGTMRPFKQSPRRVVPEHIPRPDYAVHGIPISEQAARNEKIISVADDNLVAKLRKACLVSVACEGTAQFWLRY